MMIIMFTLQFFANIHAEVENTLRLSHVRNCCWEGNRALCMSGVVPAISVTDSASVMIYGSIA